MTQDSAENKSTWKTQSEDSQQFCSGLASSIPHWLQEKGSHSNIIISTRVRLARNLNKHPFPARATTQGRSKIVNSICDTLLKMNCLQETQFLDLENLSKIDKRILVERRLASPAFVEQKGPAMIALSKNEYLSIMINEEDHLRIQSLRAGLRIADAWDSIAKLDTELGKQLDFAFSEHFGYITACPTNTGTGMRVSIFIHLPGLLLLNEMEKTISQFSASGIAIRGFYGEGSDVIGNVYQISNQLTLGCTEGAIIKLLNKVAQKLLTLEQDARERLLKSQKNHIEDKVWRAYATLTHARILSSLEFMNNLSLIRLAHDLKIIMKWPTQLFNELMLITQPGHLCKVVKPIASVENIDFLRASIVRKKLLLQS